MKVLVAYASKHGSTQGIAECIGEALVAAGQQADVLPVRQVTDLSSYDAFVIGGAAYMGSWLKEATEFVRRNQAILATRPVWLFSSGPLGNSSTDVQGRDVLLASEPKEFTEFREVIHPKSQQVFRGALDVTKLGFTDRLITKLPAAKAAGLFPEGDFRDWKTIETWAENLGRELAPATAGTASLADV